MSKAGLFFLLLLPAFTQAQETTIYAATAIPQDLKARARAVVRNMEMSITMNAPDNVLYRVKKTVTILNAAGRNAAAISLWYDKTQQINYVNGQLFDAAGNKTIKFSEKNFTDESAVQDFSLFEDSRVKWYTPSTNDYPYTIECEYEIKAAQSLSFPEWKCDQAPGIAVENTSLTVAVKPGLSVRFKEHNYPGKAENGTDKQGFQTWRWNLQHLPALKEEPLSPDPALRMRYVSIAPVRFYYRGLTGGFSDWKSFGQWVYDGLLKGRSAISPAIKEEVLSLIRDATDQKEKAARIYAYVQKKMRYVSVQIGTGGFQPVTAEETDRLSYGDCKALVNYTQALLDVAGIPSYYCIVAAGDFKENPPKDFATMDFGNHVILCLPFEQDTTWLECTSKTAPFGFLGAFTDDRDVIACTANGGLILHTPQYTPEKNRQLRKAFFTINEAGDLRGSMSTRFEGVRYEDRENFPGLSRQEQLKKLAVLYPLSEFDISSFSLDLEKGKEPAGIEKVEFSARGYAPAAQGRLFVKLNAVNRQVTDAREVSNRLNPVYIDRGYIERDSLIYQLPAGYQVEHYPPDVSIEKPFGQFNMTVLVNGRQLIYTRTLRVNDGTYPSEAYQELVNFYQSVIEADEQKIILKK